MLVQHGQTFLNPIAFFITIFSCILIFSLPRKSAFVPLLFTGIFISLQQRIVIGGADFTFLRLLLLSGLLRLIIRSEHQTFTFNTIDKCLVWFVFFRLVTYVLLWKSFGAFVNRLGGALDIIGIYFFIRIIIPDFEAIHRILKVFIVISVPLAFFMAIEWKSGRNLFSIFGGVPEFTAIRDGRLRCQGPFQHPILAGSFAASLFPIALSFWWQEAKNKKFAVLGCISTTFITITSSSSGPLLSYLSGIFVLLLWPYKEKMRTLRYGIGFTIICLHIVMKAPVWYLIARVGVVGGSTGYHRAYLIDTFINRFSEWWLFGTKSTEHWDEFGKLWDVTNNYIRVAVDGGLVTLILFIALISLCFRAIGRAWRTQDSKATQLLLWCIGASFFSHIVSFIGVSYFDQIIVPWYSLLAIISSISDLTDNEYLNLVNDKRK